MRNLRFVAAPLALVFAAFAPSALADSKVNSEKNMRRNAPVARASVADQLDTARLQYQGFALSAEQLSRSVADYRAALAQIAEELGDQPLAWRLERSLAQSERATDLTAERSRLEAELARASSDLRFRMVKEAELPEGWPEPTPVGEIRVKSYPAYRLARADMSRRPMAENTAFFSLFNHIKKHDIPMTAPVEMTVGDPKRRASGNETMGFLYQSPKVGEVGPDGKVEVSDVAPMLVVSVGLRGWESSSRVETARKELLAWIDRNGYRVAGELRSMGYNSPSVRGDRRYFEVEIPVRRKPRSVEL